MRPGEEGLTAKLEFSVGTPAFLSLSDLNKEFYRSYPRDYFWHSMLVAVSAVVDAPAALATLLETQDLNDGVSHVLRLRLDEKEVDPEQLGKSMKLQIGNIYFHALETLVRLFLAHGPETRDSPWFALARENDFRKFKEKKVTALAK
jgi:hypothetical protein